EALSFHSLGLTNGFKAVAVAKLSGEHGGNGRNAVPRPRKLAQQRIVLKLTYRDRPHLTAIQPLIQGPADRRVVGRQEDSGTVQGLREAAQQFLRERFRPHPQHLTSAERMVVSTDVEPR